MKPTYLFLTKQYKYYNKDFKQNNYPFTLFSHNVMDAYICARTNKYGKTVVM